MPYFHGAIPPRGSLIDLKVELSAPRILALRNAGQAIPPAVNLRGLLDTGADVTFIDTRHLPFVGQLTPAFAPVGTPAGGWSFQVQYDISLTILHPQGGRRSDLSIPALSIVDITLAPFLGYEALVGRDVLERCLLIYQGQGKSFTLAY
jgi:hypothetical protein